jgi:hypothetical protein
VYGCDGSGIARARVCHSRVPIVETCGCVVGNAPNVTQKRYTPSSTSFSPTPNSFNFALTRFAVARPYASLSVKEGMLAALLISTRIYIAISLSILEKVYTCVPRQYPLRRLCTPPSTSQTPHHRTHRPPPQPAALRRNSATRCSHSSSVLSCSGSTAGAGDRRGLARR